MHRGNPHSPSTAWLHSTAHPAGGYNESEPGQEGTLKIYRGDSAFLVTVKNITEEEDE